MNKRLLILLFTFSTFIKVSSTEASTFVGNGGNTGDLDLSITLAKINETLKKLDKDFSTPCECPEELSENQLCRILNSLNEQQISFCQEIIFKNKEQLITFSSKNSSIKFTWSDEAIKAKSESGSTRTVDAVTQVENNLIIIDRERFLELSQSFRIALITHELFHLIRIDEKLISDENAIEPFKDGKSLLDTLGAALAIEAYETGFTRDLAQLAQVSRSYKRHIFHLELKSIIPSQHTVNDLLIDDSAFGVTILYEYKPKNFGYRIGIESFTNANLVNSSISIYDTQNLYSLGLAYHWHPIAAKLSRWNESHISASLDLLYGDANYKATDGLVTLSDKSPAQGAQFSMQFYVPLLYGFWGSLGYQIRHIQYQYKKLELNVEDTQQSLFFGGSYAY